MHGYLQYLFQKLMNGCRNKMVIRGNIQFRYKLDYDPSPEQIKRNHNQKFTTKDKAMLGEAIFQALGLYDFESLNPELFSEDLTIKLKEHFSNIYDELEFKYTPPEVINAKLI